MSTHSLRSSGDEMVEVAATWLVAPGILTMAAFPFALPVIALTIVPVIAIALVAAAAGAVIAAVVAVGLLMLRSTRRVVGVVGRLRYRRPGPVMPSDAISSTRV
jgi:hypothetical protein